MLLRFLFTALLVGFLAMLAFAAPAVQQPNAAAQERRAAITYLREVNTVQMRHLSSAKRYATRNELLIQSPLPAGWSFVMVTDQTGYVALLTGQLGEAFTTSNVGVIYEGRVIR